MFDDKVDCKQYMFVILQVFSILFQGTIYSETAAANYPDPTLFERVRKVLPIKRLGTVEEVSD